MNKNRRSFLRKAAGVAIGIGCGLPLRSVAGRADAAGPDAADPDAQAIQWAMVVDVEKCRRPEVRLAGVNACRQAHNIPVIPDTAHEIKWIWTEQYDQVFPDQVHAHMSPASLDEPVLVMCNHCTHPPCVEVCPTRATWRRKDGIVMMDMHRCIGCRYCMAACPYGSRSFNWEDPRPFIPRDKEGRLPSDYPTRERGVVEKCIFCEERLRVGLQPACVEAANKVPGAEGALTFGNLADPKSEVSRILQRERTICRRPSLGTEPNVYYIV